MKTGTTASIKFQKLKRRLRLPQYAVIGVLESLWLFTMSNAPRGDIGRHTDEDIAAGIDYEGEATGLIQCLVGTGWLDESEEHRLVVHDWHDHAPNFIHAKLKKLGQSFVTKPGQTEGSEPTLERSQVTSEGSQVTLDASEEASLDASRERSQVTSDHSLEGTPNQTQPNPTKPPPTPPGGGEGAHTARIDPRPSRPATAAFVRPPPFAELVSAWIAARLPGHESPGGLRDTPQRRGWWQLRLDDPWWSANWRQAVDRLARSGKACGRDPAFPRGVRLEDFLKHEDYVTRILEGEFDDPRQPSTGTKVYDVVIQ
jgi:hypothetical protein